ncbi:MAG: hypothetical protein A2066_09310 [Bacteroidetes bacterium GWB2_41_8]|nr:MAG: hypothetical protein A2066_09310 [Bacteroidetes bacterium GWB2_41_8]
MSNKGKFKILYSKPIKSFHINKVGFVVVFFLLRLPSEKYGLTLHAYTSDKYLFINTITHTKHHRTIVILSSIIAGLQTPFSFGEGSGMRLLLFSK